MDITVPRDRVFGDSRPRRPISLEREILGFIKFFRQT